MSDQSGRESYDNDLGSYSLDEEDQLQPEDTLIQDGVEDTLDRGYSPPERPRGVDAYGTTASEQAHGETIDQRIRQEEPDPGSAYGAPENESRLDNLDDQRIGATTPTPSPPRTTSSATPRWATAGRVGSWLPTRAPMRTPTRR